MGEHPFDDIDKMAASVHRSGKLAGRAEAKAELRDEIARFTTERDEARRALADAQQEIAALTLLADAQAKAADEARRGLENRNFMEEEAGKWAEARNAALARAEAAEADADRMAWLIRTPYTKHWDRDVAEALAAHDKLQEDRDG
jgi:hypothetical protein